MRNCPLVLIIAIAALTLFLVGCSGGGGGGPPSPTAQVQGRVYSYGLFGTNDEPYAAMLMIADDGPSILPEQRYANLTYETGGVVYSRPGAVAPFEWADVNWLLCEFELPSGLGWFVCEIVEGGNILGSTWTTPGSFAIPFAIDPSARWRGGFAVLPQEAYAELEPDDPRYESVK